MAQLPAGIYWNYVKNDFVDSRGFSCGVLFYDKWVGLCDHFPLTRGRP